MMGRIFLGKPLYWLILAIVMGILWWMGEALLQTRDFILFLFILIGLAAAAVVILRLTYRPGDLVTREPFEDTGPEQGGQS